MLIDCICNPTKLIACVTEKYPAELLSCFITDQSLRKSLFMFKEK